MYTPVIAIGLCLYSGCSNALILVGVVTVYRPTGYAFECAISCSGADSFNDATDKTYSPEGTGKSTTYLLPNTLQLNALNLPEAVGKYSGYTYY